MTTLTKNDFKNKYKVSGPLVVSQLECGEAHYQKLKEMVYKYRATRDEVVNQIHNPQSIVHRAVKADREQQLDHTALDNDKRWEEAQAWLAWVRSQSWTPGEAETSPAKRCNNSVHEVLT